MKAMRKGKDKKKNKDKYNVVDTLAEALDSQEKG